MTTALMAERRWSDTLGIALLCGLVIAVYGQAIGFDYVNFDDGDLVRRNEELQKGFSLEFLRWAFLSIDGANWNPILWLSYALDRLIYPGPAVTGHHAANLVYHSLNSILVYLITRRLGQSSAIALACAALFAVHPQHVEAVAWIMARKDLLSTLFGLLAVYAYLDGRHASAGPRRWLWLSALMLASMMVKPMFVTLPCMLILLDYWPLGRGAGQPLSHSLPPLIIEKWPLFAVSVLGSAIGYLVHDSGGAIVNIPPLTTAGNVINAYWLALSHFYIPAALSPYYPIYPGGLDLRTLSILALLLGLSLAAWKGAVRLPYLCVGWLWFLGSFFPVSGIIHFGIHGAADRFSYVPNIGLIWASVLLMTTVLSSPAMRRLACVSVIAVAASLAWLQTGHWRNGITLFQQAHKVIGDEPFVLASLAAAYYEYGRLPEAIEYNRRGLDSLHAGALAIDGTRSRLWRNGGSYLIEYGELEAGIYYLETAQKLWPNSESLRKQLREVRALQSQQASSAAGKSQ